MMLTLKKMTFDPYLHKWCQGYDHSGKISKHVPKNKLRTSH